MNPSITLPFSFYFCQWFSLLSATNIKCIYLQLKYYVNQKYIFVLSTTMLSENLLSYKSYQLIYYSILKLHHSLFKKLKYFRCFRTHQHLPEVYFYSLEFLQFLCQLVSMQHQQRFHLIREMYQICTVSFFFKFAIYNFSRYKIFHYLN